MNATIGEIELHQVFIERLDPFEREFLDLHGVISVKVMRLFITKDVDNKVQNGNYVYKLTRSGVIAHLEIRWYESHYRERRAAQ